jgi:heme-degrading monooxygenase HmoA
MVIILFRSKLTTMAGGDYAATNDELEQHVKGNPGFIEAKGFTAADGERLTVVWWRDRESLRTWQEDLQHVKAKQAGRKHWYEYYKMEVAEVFRQSAFEREEAP